MVCLPLIERELRVALRKQRPAKGRLKVAALAAAGSVIFLLFGLLTRERSLRTPDLVEFGWTGAVQKLAADQFPDKWFLRP